MLGRIADLARSSEFDHLDVAVAYVTLSGTSALLSAMPPNFWVMRKRWLVGIDWCRSEPDALLQLNRFERSAVRVHDGEAVAARSKCVPLRSFHPKGFLFRGAESAGLLVGSANLSRNGLTTGHEANVTLVGTWKPVSDVSRQIAEASSWFAQLWSQATPFRNIEAQYRAQFDSKSNLEAPAPTEDDTAPSTLVGGRHSFSSEDLVKLRVCRNLWIEAGNLHKNRGPGLPGNQLMLRRLSRVFFGFYADDVHTDTFIGYVPIQYGTTTSTNRTLRFSNNSMDVLELPIPGKGSPDAYDQETLCFERTVRGPSRVFNLTIGSPLDTRRWQRASDAIGGSFSMAGSGRKFGVF